MSFRAIFIFYSYDKRVCGYGKGDDGKLAFSLSPNSLSERNFAVAVVEDGGRGGARAQQADAAPAEPAEEAAMMLLAAASVVQGDVPVVVKQLMASNIGKLKCITCRY